MSNILEEVQEYVSDTLNAQLSNQVTFLHENKRDIDFEIKNALGQQGIVGIVMVPKVTYLGDYEKKMLAWQIDELEIDIVENVLVNRGLSGHITGQDAAMEAFNILCPLSGDNVGKFSPISYEQGEDNSLLVNKCLFKCAVYGDRSEPQPFFPDRQGAKMSDGVFVPFSDIVLGQSFPAFNLALGAVTPYSAADIVELVAYSNVNLDSTALELRKLKRVYIDRSCQRITSHYLLASSTVEEVVFKGRTLEEVQAMENYPWGITDTSKIHVM